MGRENEVAEMLTHLKPEHRYYAVSSSDLPGGPYVNVVVNGNKEDETDEERRVGIFRRESALTKAHTPDAEHIYINDTHHFSRS